MSAGVNRPRTHSGTPCAVRAADCDCTALFSVFDCWRWLPLPDLSKCFASLFTSVAPERLSLRLRFLPPSPCLSSAITDCEDDDPSDVQLTPTNWLIGFYCRLSLNTFQIDFFSPPFSHSSPCRFLPRISRRAILNTWRRMRPLRRFHFTFSPGKKPTDPLSLTPLSELGNRVSDSVDSDLPPD